MGAEQAGQVAPVRVVVVGGAGFIGSNIARVLSRDHRVAVLDDLSVGRVENLRGSDGIEVRRASVLDADLPRHLLGADAVVNCAVTDITVSQDDPVRALRVNGEGTLRLLEAARKQGVKRVVHVSSGSVYGEARGDAMRETDPPAPLGPYGLSKLVAEQYALWHHERHGLPLTLLRLFNVYGPGQRPDNQYCQVISLFLSQAMRGEPIVVHGDGLQTRDFTYVGDVVDVVRLGLDGRLPDGEPFNVATGVQTSIRDLAFLAQQAVGREVPVVHREHLYPEHVRRRCPSTAKLWEAAGWRAQVPLRQGLMDTASWLRQVAAEEPAKVTPPARRGLRAR